MWLSFVDLPTLQFPRCYGDGHLRPLAQESRPVEISSPVSGGQAIMDLAAQGWRKALRNEAGTCQNPVRRVHPDNSSLSHFSAMARPSWLGRAASEHRHRHAIEQASRRSAMRSLVKF